MHVDNHIRHSEMERCKHKPADPLCGARIFKLTKQMELWETKIQHFQYYENQMHGARHRESQACQIDIQRVGMR